MRKLVPTLIVVFALAFGIGLTVAPQAEAAGDCFFTCDCAGRVIKCCPGGGCKVWTGPSPIQCPQIYNC